MYNVNLLPGKNTFIFSERIFNVNNVHNSIKDSSTLINLENNSLSKYRII